MTRFCDAVDELTRFYSFGNGRKKKAKKLELNFSHSSVICVIYPFFAPIDSVLFSIQARNGPQQPTATQRKVGAVFKLQKWRLHHHDKRKRKRKVQDLARQFRKTKQQEETKKIYTSKFTIKTNSEAFLPTGCYICSVNTET